MTVALMDDRMTEIMRTLGHDPAKPSTLALAYLAQRYDLDPVLKEVELIPSGDHLEPYVTRDGMLTIAHRSGKLDGITVDQWRRNSTNNGWTCYVVVWRNDMSHPFSIGAQCKDTERQAKNGWGPEQALARSMRRTLRVAFNIKTADVDEASDRDIVASFEEPDRPAVELEVGDELGSEDPPPPEYDEYPTPDDYGRV